MFNPFKQFWNDPSPTYTDSTAKGMVLQAGVRNGRNNATIIMDATNSNMAVVGDVGTGVRSALLVLFAQLITKYSPEELNIAWCAYNKYGAEDIVDEESGTPHYPHVVEFTCSKEEEDVSRFMSSIQGTYSDRVAQFFASNVSSFEEYRAKVGTMPRLLVVVSDVTMTGVCNSQLAMLMKVGPTAGIHVLLSSEFCKKMPRQLLDMCQIVMCTPCDGGFAKGVLKTDAPAYSPERNGMAWVRVGSSETFGLRVPAITSERLWDGATLMDKVDSKSVPENAITIADGIAKALASE